MLEEKTVTVTKLCDVGIPGTAVAVPLSSRGIWMKKRGFQMTSELVAAGDGPAVLPPVSRCHHKIHSLGTGDQKGLKGGFSLAQNKKNVFLKAEGTFFCNLIG